MFVARCFAFEHLKRATQTANALFTSIIWPFLNGGYIFEKNSLELLKSAKICQVYFLGKKGPVIEKKKLKYLWLVLRRFITKVFHFFEK